MLGIICRLASIDTYDRQRCRLYMGSAWQGLPGRGCRRVTSHMLAPLQVFNVTGRAQPTEADVPGVAGAGVAAGPPQQRIMQKVVLASSRALTKQPLALLVDGESASASEILAGGCPRASSRSHPCLLAYFRHGSRYDARLPTIAQAECT